MLIQKKNRGEPETAVRWVISIHVGITHRPEQRGLSPRLPDLHGYENGHALPKAFRENATVTAYPVQPGYISDTAGKT